MSCVLGMLAFGVDIVLPHSSQPSLPRPEPALTVAVTYDHCSSIGNGIGNGVLSQEAIAHLTTLTMTLTDLESRFRPRIECPYKAM